VEIAGGVASLQNPKVPKEETPRKEIKEGEEIVNKNTISVTELERRCIVILNILTAFKLHLCAYLMTRKMRR